MIGDKQMQNYHKHTSYSVGDSAANQEQYAKRAVELGHKVLSSVEHGWQGYYHQTFELAKKYGLKFVFGTEAYWVKDRKAEYPVLNSKTGEPEVDKNGVPRAVRDRTNCHMILLAKNENGRKAINRVLSEANETGYYFKPRIDLELIYSLPIEDVFITSACVAGWHYEDADDIFVGLAERFGENFALEIQYHNTEKQKKLNAHIKELSEMHGVPLIVGLDSHYIFPEEKVERDYMLAGRKIEFDDNEDGWYMDYPDDKTIMQRFLEQGIFTKEEIQLAMDRTDVLLTFGDYDDVPVFTTKIKLPSIYPDKSQQEKNKIFTKLITKKFKEFEKQIPKDRYDEYLKGIKDEIDVYRDTGMVDYPLMDYEIIKRGIEKGGYVTQSGRGSAASFFSNSLLGFSTTDRFTSPITLYPDRFMSTTRILETNSLPD